MLKPILALTVLSFILWVCFKNKTFLLANISKTAVICVVVAIVFFSTFVFLF